MSQLFPDGLKVGVRETDNKLVTPQLHRDAAVQVDAGPAAPLRRRCTHVLPLLFVAAFVGVVQPFLNTPVGQQRAFVPVMITLVCSFGVLSIALLVGEFRDTGRLRTLALSWAYMASLVLQLGWAATFPGVPATPALLGGVPSTGPWLWVAWHMTFPVLLAVAIGPWPSCANRCVAASRRRALTWATLTASAAIGGLVVAGIVSAGERLPILIRGTDLTALAPTAGPVMLPVVVLATLITLVGAWRRRGPERWAGLAATALLGDILLTLFTTHRYTIGWYGGRMLTVVSAAAVLVAILSEVSGIKRRLTVEETRLRDSLARADRVERLQHTLLEHMTDGVLMIDHTGAIVASNPRARALLGPTADEVHGPARRDPAWRLLRRDGTPMRSDEIPTTATLRTGQECREEIVGVRPPGGVPQWLSVSTTAIRDAAGSIDYVVAAISDASDWQEADLAAQRSRQARYDGIQKVLDDGGPEVVFQPIVELASGQIVGAEALARFSSEPYRPPDEWFADAATIGLGRNLELSAIRRALSRLPELPEGCYLSLNAGPATVTSEALRQMLRHVPAARVVLELTEHVGVQDYSALLEALDDLRGLGVRLAVDDTGAGVSSLQHILNLRPDIIKLDRTLVAGIEDDPARRALAGSLMTFAIEIGATVVAEGIENRREQTVLRRLGVRYGQGFHLGRPGPLPLPDATTGTPPQARVLHHR